MAETMDFLMFLAAFAVLLISYDNCICDAVEYQKHNSMFETVGRFVGSVGDVMNNVVHKVESVIESVKTFENILTDAIEEDCEYTCRNGATPIVNPKHKPQSNGCGSLGYQIAKHQLPVQELTRCCDEHDICYDTCNEIKDECDKQFKKCLYRTCEKHVGNSNDQLSSKSCKASAKFMLVGTMALGCKPYRDAQEKACLCDRKHDKEL